MSDRIAQAARAAIAGWTLGAPRRGRPEFSRLSGWDPIPSRMVAAAPIDAWIVWNAARSRGVRSERLGSFLHEHLSLTEEENAYAVRNLALGFDTPLSGAFDQPLGDGSEALLRAVYWGLVFPDQPDKAAKWAMADASITHHKEGAWMAVFFAVLASLSQPGRTFGEVLKPALSVVPMESLLHKAIPILLPSVGNPEAPREIRRSLPETLRLVDPHHAVLTTSWALLGLMHGGAVPGPSMLIAAGCGASSGHSAGLAAVIGTLMIGTLDQEWVGPLGGDYIATHGLRGVEPPKAIMDFALAVADSAEKTGVSATEPEVPPTPVVDIMPETSGEPPEMAEATPVPMPEAAAEPVKPPVPLPDPSVREDLQKAPDRTSIELNGLVATMQFLDPPVAVPGKTTRAQLTVHNPTSEDRTIQIDLGAPYGWELASRVQPSTLRAGGSSSFPVVIRPPETSSESGNDTHLRLRIDGLQALIPLVAPVSWLVVGPFINIEGQGYDKEQLPEKLEDRDAVYSGRSDMPLRWQPWLAPGAMFDLEPLFNNGPGVAYLWMKAKFERAGAYRLQISGPGGVKLWVDKYRRIAYHDHRPVPLRQDPKTVADFESPGETTFLVKVVRGTDPIPPLLIALFNDEGRLVRPVECLPMG